MLNVSYCDLILYNSFDDNFQIISTGLNYDYCKCMLFNLKSVYFDKLLHKICKLSDCSTIILFNLTNKYFFSRFHFPLF